MADEDQMQRSYALLDWYAAMGADAVVADASIDWLQRPDMPPGAAWRKAQRAHDAQNENAASGATSQVLVSKTSQQAGAPAAYSTPRRFTSQTPAASIKSAHAAAGAASDLTSLQSAIEQFDGCSLKTTAKNTCVYRGAEKARLMIIGEAPGRDEDLAGKPFVGRAGQLLDKMLASIGLDENHVHITNIVYWRPPGNRTPTPHEAEVCRPFLERQVRLVEPDFLVFLGGAAAKNLLNTTSGIMRLRGKWHQIEIGEKTLPALATLHPAYLLRTPAAKRLAWRDLLAVKSMLT